MAPPQFEKRVIGNATLYRGDSIELLRAGVFGKLGAIVSDPPYGIGYRHGGEESRSRAGTRVDGSSIPAKTTPIMGDDAPFDPRPWIGAAPLSSPRAGDGAMPLILLWGADHFRARLPDYGTFLAWDKHVGRGADDSFTDCEWA